MVCDDPEAYEGQPGFDFLREVPTVWEQTVVPGGEVGDWVCIARRKGTDWYVGAINNSTPRTITISLIFLPAGTYHPEIYRDVTDALHHPSELIKETKEVKSNDKMVLDLPDGGGEVVRFSVSN